MADWTISLPTYVERSRLRLALGKALGIDPLSIQLEETLPSSVPTVVMVTEDGKTDVTAVSGMVHVIHADMDREGSTLSEQEVDEIMTPSLMDGTPQELAEAVYSAREGLGRYITSPSGPAFRS